MDLMLRRRGIMTTAHNSILPPGYTRVDYIEAPLNELCYIDTGVIPTTKTQLKIEFQLPLKTQQTGIAGLYGTGLRFHCGVYQGRFHVGIGNDGNWRNLSSVDINRHTITLKGNGTYQLDSVTGALNAVPTNTRSIYLFAQNESNMAPSFVRMFDVVIAENDIEIRHFIPCRDSRNVGYLYDTVSKTLYENLGTGSFVVGPDYGGIIIPVEYLESDGYEHIFTELFGSNNVRFAASFKLNSLISPEDANTATILGSRQTHASNGQQLSTYRGGSVQHGATLYSSLGVNSTNVDYTVIEDSTNIIYVNSTQTKTINEVSFNTPQPICLFGLWQQSSSLVTEHLSGRIYYIRFFDKNTGDDIARLIPIRIGNLGCMYDEVAKKILSNSGPGRFIVGPDKSL